MTESEVKQNGWNEWSRYVLKELERLNDIVKDVQDKAAKLLADVSANRATLDSLKADIADLKLAQATTALAVQSLTAEVTGLKVKAGVWGALAGLIPVVAMLLVEAIKGK
jgi:hypothetical protein